MITLPRHYFLRKRKRDLSTLRQEFIAFSVAAGVLSFGEFITKAGRVSPYFFNAGLFNDGKNLGQLAHFYARALLDSKVDFDMLYGPAYKGITLASATAVALANVGRNVSFAYNRKEVKDHGEGGGIVGAPLQGKVVIVDDVISAGTSVRESIELIRSQGAHPCAVLVALDRMEKVGKEGALSECSALQEVSQIYAIPVISIASLVDLLEYVSCSGADSEYVAYEGKILAYRRRYGVA